MRSPLPFPCVPDRPYKILLAQVGTLSFSHPLFGVSVLFIYLFLPRAVSGLLCVVGRWWGGLTLPQRPSLAVNSKRDGISEESLQGPLVGWLLMKAPGVC